MNSSLGPGLVRSIAQYRSRLAWTSLVMVGFILPSIGVLLQKNGEGYEFQNLLVYVHFFVSWFIITSYVVYRGAPLHWTMSIGTAPSVAESIINLFDISSNYAAAGHNFWLLFVTGDKQVIEAILFTFGYILLVGIPLPLISYICGCIIYQYRNDIQNGRISQKTTVLLIGSAITSMYIGYYLGKSISPSVLSP